MLPSYILLFLPRGQTYSQRHLHTRFALQHGQHYTTGLPPEPLDVVRQRKFKVRDELDDECLDFVYPNGDLTASAQMS